MSSNLIARSNLSNTLGVEAGHRADSAGAEWARNTFSGRSPGAPPLTEAQALKLVAAIIHLAGLENVSLYQEESDGACFDLDLPKLDSEEIEWHLSRFATTLAPVTGARPAKDRTAAERKRRQRRRERDQRDSHAVTPVTEGRDA